jgi:exonuclease III
LALKIKIGDFIMALIAIYGPNDNRHEFYSDLNRTIQEINCEFLIIGGDWNSTWDQSPPEHNLDILHMANIPSRYRSEQVSIIAQQHDLVEPYRMLNPTGRDYTYIPNAQRNVNWSRIDYFLVTSNLIQSISESGIGQNRLSTLFDHKPVSLQVGHKKISVDRNKICNGILDNVIVELTVTLSVKEFYLNNADHNAVPQFIINPIRYEIGRIYNLL